MALMRLQEKFNNEIVSLLMKRFKYTSNMQVPRLDKIVLSVGVGEATQNPKAIENVVRDVSIITGQKPITTRAKCSVSSFKLRQGMPIGVKVTLRRHKMYAFYDRLVNIALPRLRDFRGLAARSFDGHGNYALGLKEQLIFPEIDYDSIDKVRGMNIVIATTAKTDEEAHALLKYLGMPFRPTTSAS